MKQPELFRATNWEFNLAFKRKWKIAHKKPSLVPLYPTWPAHSHVNHYRKPGRVCPLGEERDGGAKTLQVHPLVSLQFLGFESHRAFRTLPLYFISTLSHHQPFIPSHCLPPHTKYIYNPAVCCRWTPSAGFPLLGRVQETRWREDGRKRKKSE